MRMDEISAAADINCQGEHNMLDRIFISSDIEGTCGICHWD